MKMFTLKLQAMCGEKIGLYLQAYLSTNKKIFAGRPIARFQSLVDLDAACESVGVACSPWGGPSPDTDWELSCEELQSLGFKLNQQFLTEWSVSMAASRVGVSDVGHHRGQEVA